MPYDYITSRTSPNQSGPRPSRPTGITVHWWNAPATKPKFDGVVDYLCRTDGTSSAHYVAESGRVACIVDPDNIAWHAGFWPANQSTIGIECSPYATDSDYETVAELIADLRETYGNLPLYPHKHWKATACPGAWDLDRLDRMADAVTMRRDTGTGGGKSKPPSKPKPKRPNVKRLQSAVNTGADNIWGPKTEKHLQAVRQASRYHGVLFPYGVPLAQKAVRTAVDGVWGPKSRRAHDKTVKRVQRALKKLKAYGGKVDGIWGRKTDAGFLDIRGKAR